MTQQASPLSNSELTISGVVIYANMHDRMQQDPRQFLIDSGFRIYNSSGLSVYRKDDPATGEFVLVYDNEGDGIPKTFADIEMCRYDADGCQASRQVTIYGEEVHWSRDVSP